MQGQHVDTSCALVIATWFTSYQVVDHLLYLGAASVDFTMIALSVAWL